MHTNGRGKLLAGLARQRDTGLQGVRRRGRFAHSVKASEYAVVVAAAVAAPDEYGLSAAVHGDGGELLIFAIGQVHLELAAERGAGSTVFLAVDTPAIAILAIALPA